jgi:hypothetical protein
MDPNKNKKPPGWWLEWAAIIAIAGLLGAIWYTVHEILELFPLLGMGGS